MGEKTGARIRSILLLSPSTRIKAVMIASRDGRLVRTSADVAKSMVSHAYLHIMAKTGSITWINWLVLVLVRNHSWLTCLQHITKAHREKYRRWRENTSKAKVDTPYVCGWNGCPRRFLSQDSFSHHQRKKNHRPDEATRKLWACDFEDC